ncbi:YdcF family protein [Butyrivibrio sp. AE3004]|uniref:YdcF family protein n=1 Tax=Butyrivibrio sp. AE3004 TaxID=1506994 RepID=UPI000AEF4512|nr:YdcF family protein [Butyrivibrio sp. AE3004]
MIYSISIYLVGSGTFSFVIWIAGAAFFAVAFFFSGNERWMKVPGGFRKICYCLIALVFVVLITCVIAMLSHFSDKGEDNLDYIVVLGAQMRDSGPSIVFKYRLDAAYEYLEKNPGTICIVSGGQGPNESISEGEGGKTYLANKGLDPERIIAETKAIDTTENIAFSMNIIDGRDQNVDKTKKIGIVTNNFHVFRGVHIAKKQTTADIYGIAAYTEPWYLPNNMVRESFGIIRDLPLLY